jgi:protein YIPF6
MTSQQGWQDNGPAWANPAPSNLHQRSSASSSQPVTTVEQHELELFHKHYSTLDEPVKETILRDVRAVASKLRLIWQASTMHPTVGLTAIQSRAMNVRAYSNYIYSRVSPNNAPVAHAVATEDVEQTDSQTENTSAAGASTQTNTQASQTSESTQTDSIMSMASFTQIATEHDRQAIQELKDWDLWGPLLLCLALGVLLALRAPPHQAHLVFAAVFGSVWLGGTIVTLNAQCLGGTLSFFQSLCVLGYSLFPLTLAAGVIGTLHMVLLHHVFLWMDILIVAVGYVWATRITTLFISLYIAPQRLFLALYPVFFFFIFMSWLILLF